MLGLGVVGDVSFAPAALLVSGEGVCDRLTDRKVAAILYSGIRDYGGQAEDSKGDGGRIQGREMRRLRIQ